MSEAREKDVTPAQARRDVDRPEAEIAALAAEEKTSELSILKESLDEARKQSADYYDQLIRLKAEFENFRKRAERDKADARRWGKEEMLLQLISLMDVVSQAEAAAQKGSDLKSITAGLHMLYGEFKRLLKDEGIEEVPAEGRRFDPSMHEAVETVEEEGDDGRILSVLQRGYKFQGNLMRPARVRVSKQKSE